MFACNVTLFYSWTLKMRNLKKSKIIFEIANLSKTAFDHLSAQTAINAVCCPIMKIGS